MPAGHYGWAAISWATAASCHMILADITADYCISHCRQRQLSRHYITLVHCCHCRRHYMPAVRRHAAFFRYQPPPLASALSPLLIRHGCRCLLLIFAAFLFDYCRLPLITFDFAIIAEIRYWCHVYFRAIAEMISQPDDYIILRLIFSARLRQLRWAAITPWYITLY